MPVGSKPSILLVTNDFGPRAGGIETFIIGLLERMQPGTVMVYTSQQAESESFDQRWRERYGVLVIRDRSSILLPTPRVTRAIKNIIRREGIESVWFGAAAPLAVMAKAVRAAGVKKIVALTHGHEAIAQIATLNPDIVVVDIHLPDGNGIDVVRWARTHSRKIGLVVLTVSHMPEQIKAAMQAGASGYVEKSAPIAELVSAIKHAAHSPLAFSTHRARDLFDYGSQAHGLTGRELEVLEILPSGKTIHQIAETLFLGDSTVKTHVAAIYRKLCVANRVAAINKAREFGLLQ